MDEEVKKVLIKREANVDKAFEDYRFQRNLLDNYWDDIHRKRNWIIRTREEIQSAESSIRSSEEIFRKLKTEIELRNVRIRGDYLNSMFVAVAMDGNNNTTPIAFGIGVTNNVNSCTWFLMRLKDAIGEGSEVVFITDRVVMDVDKPD
ncbi:unnamed protein product [Lactuca saligna]|uniref:Uncharacterized protein n=1 Tax=Lactuca saligna TaxID=75948 RepID=A0AA35VH90_LACSI|nr:unnamed protein product [Lactuca saligna]